MRLPAHRLWAGPARRIRPGRAARLSGPGTGYSLPATRRPLCLLPLLPVGNLTFSEIIWIVVIILIVFGPQRLPEMARKAGRFMAKARDAANALQKQITEEYGDTIAPLKEVGDELKEARRSLTDSAKAAARDLEESTRIQDVTKELKEAQRQVVDDVSSVTKPPPEPSSADADVVPEDVPPSGDGDS